MISLKRYLDAADAIRGNTYADPIPPGCESLLAAYRSALTEIGVAGSEVCPAVEKDLKQGIAHLDALLAQQPSARDILEAKRRLSRLLQEWSKNSVEFYRLKTGEVKDLLLVVARTAESLGHKDERYAKQFDSLTDRLATIATLDDVTEMRSSVEESARDLKQSISRMNAESKMVTDHLRAEVATYQAKLDKAEYIASCDSLTGLGSRSWIENRIQERIESAPQFSLLLIDIEDFRHVNTEHGSLVADQLLKEFSRELRSCCRFSDLVARWSGDRFIVVLDGLGVEAARQAERLRSCIARPYHVPGRTGYVNIRIEVTIGIAERRERDQMEDLLERADCDLAASRSGMRAKLSA